MTITRAAAAAAAAAVVFNTASTARFSEVEEDKIAEVIDSTASANTKRKPAKVSQFSIVS